MQNDSLQIFRDTIKYSGEMIFIKPFCDFFQISYENQCRNINSDKILQTSSIKKSDMLLFGDKRQRVALSKIAFIRWIQLINPQTVQVTLREKLEEYQRIIVEFLFGSVKSQEKASVAHKRLLKLQKLKNVICQHINECKADIKAYVDGSLVQGKLNF